MAGDRGPGGALSPALLATCACIADVMRGAREPWWIIASVAVALHGAAAGEIGDVDLLADPDDARRFADHCGIVLAPGEPDAYFRSALFGCWTAPPLKVDVMAGFEVATAEGWRAVAPATRVAIELPGGTVYVPDRVELIALLRTFGRPKDLARAAALAAI